MVTTQYVLMNWNFMEMTGNSILKTYTNMKRIIKSILYVACFAFLAGCEDMNSVNQEYLDRGEVIYTARIDSVQSVKGLNKVQFNWWLKGDPRITQTEILWTEGVTPKNKVIDVNRTQSGAIEMETVLEDIPEGVYYFEFVTKGDEGVRSVSLGKTVEIFGNKYLESLRNRPVTSVIYTDDSQLIILWDANPANGAGCYLSYTNTADRPVNLYIPTDETSTTILDWKSGLSYHTQFVSAELPLEDTLSIESVSPAIRESEPFNGPHILSVAAPCEIEARDFDYGGEGLAYHDVSNRTTVFNYRRDAGDYLTIGVDIDGSSIGYGAPGEWMVYTVEVRDAGVYAADVRLSANNAAGGSFYFSVDGERLETVTTPNQNSWNNWIYVFDTHPEFVQPTFRLSVGTHKIRFTHDGGGFNWIGFKFIYVGE
jgi:hypothetical protein